MDQMMVRLKAIAKRYEELSQVLMDPAITNDIARLTAASKEQAELAEPYQLYQEYERVAGLLEQDREALKDEAIEQDDDLQALVSMEIAEYQEKLDDLYERLRLCLIVKDPDDKRNIIMEIRGAAGGDEGNIFAGDLYRMYLRYCESQGWKVEVLEANESEAGGYSLISFMVKGENVYAKLKYESGAHRVQRVPKTETQGRVHTSTATVLVMPEVEDVEVEINPSDLRIDTYRSSGAGGQHINKTDSAVRITHLPTGIVATSQDGRSQHDNRDKAMRALRARIYEAARREQEEKVGSVRKTKIGSGDRAEKIRTYNYPQNRVTDHRISLSLQQLDRVMEGHLEGIIEALMNADQKLKMEQEHDYL